MSEQNGYKVVDFELNERGIGKILKSDGVMKALEDAAPRVGNGEIETKFVGFSRAVVLVRSDRNAN